MPCPSRQTTARRDRRQRVVYRYDSLRLKAGTKYPATSVRYEVSGGKMKITQIRLGKTNLKLVLGAAESDAATATGQAIH